MGFAAEVRLLFGDAFLVQMSNSLADPGILTVGWHRALPFFQLLHGGPVVDAAPQGGHGTGFGLAVIPRCLLERWLLRVRGLRAGCGRVRQQRLRHGRVPGAARRVALLLEPGRLIHDAHERSVARSVLGGAHARDLVSGLVFDPSLWPRALEAVGKTAAGRQAAG